MIRPRKLGQIFLRVANVERSRQFYTEVLGLKVTGQDGEGRVFLRTGGDHHNLVLIPATQGKGPGPERFVYEVRNIDELKAAFDHLKEKGVEILQGPGWWDEGHHIELQFSDPDGYRIGYYCNIDQVGEEGPKERIKTGFHPMEFGPTEG